MLKYLFVPLPQEQGKCLSFIFTLSQIDNLQTLYALSPGLEIFGSLYEFYLHDILKLIYLPNAGSDLVGHKKAVYFVNPKRNKNKI
jgi:hypothetical protein